MAESATTSSADGDAGPADIAPERTAPLGGATEAAILLMALGEDQAAEVLRFMKPAEVQALGTAMTAIDGVSQQAIAGALECFRERIGDESSLGMDSDAYFRDTLERAIGPQRANNVLSSLEPSPERRRPASLAWLHTRSIVRLLSGEHPQMIATVLGLMAPERAGEVLAALPEDGQADLVRRISTLDRVHPAALAEIDTILREGLEADGDVELSGIGGVSTAAEMLNAVGKAAEQRILEAIDEQDEELGTRLREGMFVFENLLAVDARGLQTLLRDVNNEELILALKGASEELRQKIFANMSKRAAELLADDLDAKGPVRLSDVEDAQRAILTVAKRLEEEGQIQLGSSGEALV